MADAFTVDNSSEKLGAAKWSVIVNVLIIALKLTVGIYTGSLGILAEFIHSALDLLASVFAYLGIRKASEPADMTHLYGHERFENISSLVQAMLINLTSILILYEAYLKLASHEHMVKESLLGIGAMIITLLIDVKLSDYLHKKSNATGSPALEADAYHFTVDIFGTLAVILGLAATSFGYPIADIFSAVLVALLMIYLSLNLGKKAISIMLDHAPDNRTMELIASIISSCPDVRSYHSLRARISGQRLFIDFCIDLKGDLSLSDAHKISEDLETEIVERCPIVKEVVIHLEPEGPHHQTNAIRRIFG